MLLKESLKLTPSPPVNGKPSNKVSPRVRAHATKRQDGIATTKSPQTNHSQGGNTAAVTEGPKSTAPML